MFSLDTTGQKEAEILCHEHGAKLLRESHAFEQDQAVEELTNVERAVDSYIDDLAAASDSLDVAVHYLLVE
jgi:hypothetical protein